MKLTQDTAWDNDKLAGYFAASNAAFRKAGKAAKRVMITQDVIAFVKADKLLATTGTYCAPMTTEDEPYASCKVCGVGSLLVAATYRKGAAIKPDDDVFDRLRPWFSEKQLLLIEEAFECWEDFATGCWGNAGGSYWPASYTPQQRLLSIMRNIVRNGGKFVPRKQRKAKSGG